MDLELDSDLMFEFQCRSARFSFGGQKLGIAVTCTMWKSLGRKRKWASEPFAAPFSATFACERMSIEITLIHRM